MDRDTYTCRSNEIYRGWYLSIKLYLRVVVILNTHLIAYLSV